MSNGTTLCTHCATRFKVAEEQLSAHQGMVRCGHCLQAFDARPNFIPEQPSPQLDLPIDELVEHDEPASVAEQAEHSEVQVQVPETIAPEIPAEVDDLIDESSLTQPESIHLPIRPEHDDTLDFSQLATTHAVAEPPEPDELLRAETEQGAEFLPQDGDEDDTPIPAKRRTWLWVAGLSVATLLLLLQSAYFFRISLAARMPALKPALVSFCQLLTCTVPLPQNTELVSIESSSLDAEPAHENQITFNALLRNRASYALAFPVLALTLNDNQDKPLARRLFLPKEYLPTNESEQAGLLANHEVSLKLHMDTAELRPVGYRLELY